MKKSMMLALAAAFSLTLAGCANENEGQKKEESSEHAGHEGMNHSGSGELPEGLKEAENPAFEKGSKAVMNADHMEGMGGAEATIAGAYDTTVYTVSYTPEGGGDPVTDHKWVIHEEIKDAAEEPYKEGDKVTLAADHMEGMDGAEATIDSAEETTVYMVDFVPSDGGEEVKNHKWVTESELSAAE
ncbi:YdhK family protein [Bacillus sp. FSL H8-0547]